MPEEHKCHRCGNMMREHWERDKTMDEDGFMTWRGIYKTIEVLAVEGCIEQATANMILEDLFTIKGAVMDDDERTAEMIKKREASDEQD